MSPVVVLERYEVLRRLASGGMGDVFLAQQRGQAGFRRRVVLKTIRPEHQQRVRSVADFLAEARHVATLNHPHVVSVLEVGEDRGVLVLVMELVEGVDLRRLRQRLARARQRMPYRIAACLVRDAALGLAHAHAASPAIVHLDVSSSNLMVRADGLTKVVDFGIAASLEADAASAARPLRGKLRYIAPEQIMGAAPSPLIDQYALGRVLEELLRGVSPFEGLKPKAVREGILSGVRAPLVDEVPGLPEPLDAICDRMLSLAPELRFPDLTAVARALEPHVGVDGHGVTARFVQAVAGATIEALRVEQPPEEVQIPGLRDAARSVCAKCGYTNPVRHLYCGACGAPLTAASAPPEPAVPRPAEPEDAPRSAGPSLARAAARLSTQLGPTLPALVGRTEVRLRADAALAAARDGKGGGLVVHGRAGFGRTALLTQLAEDAAAHGLSVHRLDAAPTTSLAVRIAHAVGGVVGEAAPGDVDDSAARAAGAVRAAAEERPVAVLIDDLPVADARALGVVRALAAMGATAPVAVVAMADGAPGATEALEVSALPRLSDDDVIEVGRQALGADLDAEVARTLVGLADGRPGWAWAWAWHLRTTEAVARGPSGWRLVDPKGPSARLEDVFAAQTGWTQRFLEVAAEAGAVFDADTVAQAAGVEVDVEALEDTGFLRRVDGAPGQLRFPLPELRRFLQSRGADERRARWRAQLAAAAARTVGPVEAARYALRGETPARAVAALLRAAPSLEASSLTQDILRSAPPVLEAWAPREISAEEAAALGTLARATAQTFRGSDPRAGLPLLDRLVDLLAADPAAAGEARVWRAGLRLELGHVQDALSDLEAAAHARGGGRTWAARLAEARAWRTAGAPARAVEGLQEGLRAAEVMAPAEEAEVATELGRLELTAGRPEAARPLFERAVGLVSASDPVALRARTNLGVIDAQLGETAMAVAALTAVEADARAVGADLEAARAAYNLGRAHALGGDPASAAQAFLRAERGAAQLGWAEGLAAARWARDGLTPAGSGSGSGAPSADPGSTRS